MARELEASRNDGMRSLRREEFDSLRQLLGTVFRPSLTEEYPHIYTPENAATLRVVVRDGQVVSHIGTLRRDASLLGCTVRAASLGGVATYEEHRGKGYATALFEDTLRACREDGVDFMHVSGYRRMYHRFGCRYVGRNWSFHLPAELAAAARESIVSLRPAGDTDLAAMAAVYRLEAVRWLRPPSDFANTLRGFVMNRPAHVMAVCERDAFRGYIVLVRPDDEKGAVGRILEFAGDRGCLVASLGALAEQFELSSLDLHVQGHDTLLQDLLGERGAMAEPAPTSGTVTLVNFRQLLDRMRPYFAERIGSEAAAALVFARSDDHFVFGYGAEQIVADDKGAAVQLIFGTPDGEAEEEMLRSGGKAGEILREVLPIPTLWYGINYV